MTRIYLSPPHLCGKELEFVNDVFASNWIAPIGPHVDGLEKEFCRYSGAGHAAALSSGTAGLHLALQLCGVGPGDDVLCSSFTFAGSAFPISYMGATPVFIDSEERTWNIDPELLRKAILARRALGKKVSAVIIVHLYGQSADIDPIADICDRLGITLIEDAAESVGTLYKGKHTGTIGRIGIYSFNGNKIITTSGGGMIVSSDKSIIDQARFLSTQARDPAPYYEHTRIGYNYRMSNVVAAIGRGQLTAIEQRVAKKRDIFEQYRSAFRDIDGIGLMPEETFNDPRSRSNRWLTCITLDPKKITVTPEQIRLALETENIESRPLWKPMHLQPVFKDCPSFISGVSQKLFETGLCLPSGTAMSADDLERVVAGVRKIIVKKKI